MAKKDQVMQFAADAAVIGAAGAVSVAATDYVFDEWSKMVGYSRGAAQAGLHIALGAGIAYAGAPKVGAGVAIGGVVSGVEDAITWARADEAQRNAMKAAQAARVEARRARANQQSGSQSTPAAAQGAAQGSTHTAAQQYTSRGLPSGALGDRAYADRPRVMANG